MNRGQIITLLGALALLIAAFLPWINVTALFGDVPGVEGGIAIGWEGDSYITGGIGLILLVIALLSKGRSGKRYSIAAAVLGSLAGVVVLMDFRAIAKIGPEGGIFASTDVGLYLTLMGAFVAILGGLQTISSSEAELRI